MFLIRMKKYYYRIFPKKFHKIWKRLKNKDKIDDDLKYITDKFILSQSYKTVSNYWHILNIKNFNSLADYGIEKYGSTIAQNYFTFTEMYHDEWFDLLVAKLNNKSFIIESDKLFKKQKNFSLKDSISYNYLCYLLYFTLKRSSYFNYLSRLNDKSYIGFEDPYLIIDNLKITTDKIVSLFDCENIFKTFGNIEINKILEIGAGSGRTSEAFLTIKEKKNSKYIICDIPPAIYVSYKRLKIAFPNKKISLLIDTDNKNDLKNKIEESDISFIFPHQLKLLDKKFIDLTIAIDCLHEMDKSVIQYYINSINEFSKNFYFSVWEKTEVPYSKNIFRQKNILDHYKNDYMIPTSFKNILKENLIFPCNQIALGYKIEN